MITIQIAREVSADAFARVEALAETLPVTSIEFNGENIKVKRDDFTCVDGGDEIAGAALLRLVHRTIDVEE